MRNGHLFTRGVFLWDTDFKALVMKVIETDIKGVSIIEPQLFGDNRGYFFESYNQKLFNVSVIGKVPGMTACEFVQDNESKSSYGVVRGLHFQKPPYAQSKLIRVVKGEVLDVAVDIRRGSPTFGKYVAARLSGSNHLQFFIPRGFAHGFSVLSQEAILQYKCDSFYNRESEGAIAWNDPQLNIDWGVEPGQVILSEKDRSHPLLSEAPYLFDYNENLYQP